MIVKLVHGPVEYQSVDVQKSVVGGGASVIVQKGVGVQQNGLLQAEEDVRAMGLAEHRRNKKMGKENSSWEVANVSPTNYDIARRHFLTQFARKALALEMRQTAGVATSQIMVCFLVSKVKELNEGDKATTGVDRRAWRQGQSMRQSDSLGMDGLPDYLTLLLYPNFTTC
ncbi:hypothetical protein V6N12_007503 [Hibiscus sabdariffa]|uniref:Uncharacterized protein n=1 Tax=Hibiscus sabdariffa TaxID=183260 RepID=A0ABR2F1Y9_9ROSI